MLPSVICQILASFSIKLAPVWCGLGGLGLPFHGVCAWLGHGGFDFPGSGNYYHHIHHTAFDANFGTDNVPIDWLLGTFASTEDDITHIWSEKDVGMKGNPYPVHQSRKDLATKVKSQ